MISTADENKKDKARELWNEAQELAKIFGKISSTLNQKKEN